MHLPPKPNGLKASVDAVVTKIVPGLPRVAAEIAARLPEPVNRRLVERFLNTALQGPLSAGEFDFLRGRTVTIRVLDADWSITITALDDRHFRLLNANGAETCISATARDFMGLTLGRIDPDTLFFQRRLRIEGNVALGLETKNTLDGVERESLPRPLRTVLQLVQVCLSRYEAHSPGASRPPPRLSSPARPYQ